MKSMEGPRPRRDTGHNALSGLMASNTLSLSKYHPETAF